MYIRKIKHDFPFPSLFTSISNSFLLLLSLLGAKLGIVSKTNHGSRVGGASAAGGAASAAVGVVGDGAPGPLPGLHNTYDAVDGTSEQNFFFHASLNGSKCNNSTHENASPFHQ